MKGLFSFILVTILFSSVNSEILQSGNKAPGFSMLSVSGNREALSVWCGSKLSKPYINSEKNTVILSFWATYCAPCQKEIPELHKFYEKHKGENIKIFLISIDEKGSSIVTPFVKKKGYTLPVLFDPYKKTAERYGVTSLPSLFVISPDGTVQFSSEGYHQDVSLVKLLEDVISGKNEELLKDSSSVADSNIVSVHVPKDVVEQPVEKIISPKKKWHAVALVECGTALDSVAAKLGVAPDSIKAWYADIKKSAIGLWSSKKRTGN